MAAVEQAGGGGRPAHPDRRHVVELEPAELAGAVHRRLGVGPLAVIEGQGKERVAGGHHGHVGRGGVEHRLGTPPQMGHPGPL